MFQGRRLFFVVPQISVCVCLFVIVKPLNNDDVDVKRHATPGIEPEGKKKNEE